MSREWAAGDVGVNVRHGYRGIFVAGFCYAHQRQGCWHNESGHSDPPDDVRRPLAVIDFEDREQVERLRDLYDAAVIRMNDDPDPRDVTPEQRTTAMQSAFLTLANPKPPKPDEPTGWGAVVEDDTGAYWTLYAPEAGVWINYREGKRRWPDIAAVRVLSEGVPQ